MRTRRVVLWLMCAQRLHHRKTALVGPARHVAQDDDDGARPGIEADERRAAVDHARAVEDAAAGRQHVDAQEAEDRLVRTGRDLPLPQLRIDKRPVGCEERRAVGGGREESARRPQRVAEAVVRHLVPPSHQPRQMSRTGAREPVRLVARRLVGRVRELPRPRQLVPENRLQRFPERVLHRHAEKAEPHVGVDFPPRPHGMPPPRAPRHPREAFPRVEGRVDVRAEEAAAEGHEHVERLPADNELARQSAAVQQQVPQRDRAVLRRQVQLRIRRDGAVEVQPPLGVQVQEDGMEEELREGGDAEERVRRRRARTGEGGPLRRHDRHGAAFVLRVGDVIVGRRLGDLLRRHGPRKAVVDRPAATPGEQERKHAQRPACHRPRHAGRRATC